MLQHVSVYAGVPAANHAFQVAKTARAHEATMTLTYTPRTHEDHPPFLYSGLQGHAEAVARDGAHPDRAVAVRGHGSGSGVGRADRGRRGPDDERGHGRRGDRAALDHHRSRARRARRAAAERVDRDLAGERVRSVHALARGRLPRPARPELPRRRSVPHERRRRVPLPHREARALSLGEPLQRVETGAHPLLAARARAHDPARHADVLPRRPALRVRPDLPVGARARVGALGLDLRPRGDESRAGRSATAGTSCCGAPSDRGAASTVRRRARPSGRTSRCGSRGEGENVLTSPETVGGAHPHRRVRVRR